MGLPAEKESGEGGLAGGAAERAGKHGASVVRIEEERGDSKGSGDGEWGED